MYDLDDSPRIHHSIGTDWNHGAFPADIAMWYAYHQGLLEGLLEEKLGDLDFVGEDR
jgi:hypothetical protein